MEMRMEMRMRIKMGGVGIGMRRMKTMVFFLASCGWRIKRGFIFSMEEEIVGNRMVLYIHRGGLKRIEMGLIYNCGLSSMYVQKGDYLT